VTLGTGPYNAKGPELKGFNNNNNSNNNNNNSINNSKNKKQQQIYWCSTP